MTKQQILNNFYNIYNIINSGQATATYNNKAIKLDAAGDYFNYLDDGLDAELYLYFANNSICIQPHNNIIITNNLITIITNIYDDDYNIIDSDATITISHNIKLLDAVTEEQFDDQIKKHYQNL